MSESRGSQFALSRSNPFFCSDFFFFLVGGREKGRGAPTQRESLGRGARESAAAPAGASGGRALARVSIGTPFRRLETHPLPAAAASPKY